MNKKLIGLALFLVLATVMTALFFSAPDYSPPDAAFSDKLIRLEKNSLSEICACVEPEEVFIRLYLKEENRVARISLEEYVLGVLYGEMPYSYGKEALKAQAVASRTYALRKIMTCAEGSLYDVCDSPACCQCYISEKNAVEAWSREWVDKISPVMYQAVEETRGEVLFYDGEIVNAMCFASSGRKTESSENVFGNKVPYLTVRDNPDESSMEGYRTSVSFTQDEFEKLCGILNVTETRLFFNSSGRVDRMTVCGDTTVTISGREVRTLFGLRSTNFKISKENAVYTFTVEGFGHGIGMSQYGAKMLAESGMTYIEILAHYYSGTKLEAIY